ncbi:MAG: SDR family oxidoreductase [Pseudomonadota bacterium]|nr:SDR family oxidoreductase [Pseudomonadota bacterium]MEC7138610.1 SDR family oxidoreductase [Pseudomonadota bacterium]MEC7420301.1 SDR family oxidoreductase [Pseudomonadota bacterium]MEC7957176.1 SDR family oxidoreductase [Pseudomonadota bacterium]MEC7975526.1 SDR family oxidoreductase [Pseudomonadota bacterium]|tara:strand:- start:282 stop:1154 length:873 start_codon:yes stop_codon:yes gene_type:complete
MTISFADQVAIVTGAGGGLGRCHALELARRGAKVVVNDLGGAMDGSGGSSEAAEAVVAEIKAMGGEAVANGGSVSDRAGAQSMVDDAMNAWGRVDVLINNAGILRDKSFSKMTLDDFDMVINVHLLGAAYCSHAVWPIMREQNYGRILMTTSPTGLYGNFGQTNYGAAKLGQVGLMNSLKIEGAKNNIYTNTIAPVAATRMTENLMPEEVLDKLGPELVTPAALFLVSESAPNGVILQAQGGNFSLAGIFENAGVNLGVEATVDDIAENYEAIVDMADLKPRGMLQLNAM